MERLAWWCVLLKGKRVKNWTYRFSPLSKATSRKAGQIQTGNIYSKFGVS